MCGFSGYLLADCDQTADRMQQQIRTMTRVLSHRGPDDEGFLVDQKQGLAIGHRRLSILDLSALGRQPMTSSCGGVVMAYNGEVYNFRALRSQLEKHGRPFRSDCDSEVLVECLAEYGHPKSAQLWNGMFAVASWDQRTQTLSLIRDRLGIKPLYFATTPHAVLFGSELKALRAYGGYAPSLRRSSVAQVLRDGYVSGPEAIYQDAYRVLPGEIISISRDDSGFRVAKQKFWKVSESGPPPQQGLDVREADAGLEDLLRQSVRDRLIADVPVGAFLSGGVDSSLVVSLMRDVSPDRITTVTMGFQEPEYDESAIARSIAQHFGTNHIEHTVTADDGLQTVEELATVYDEPFADSSQIPTLLLSRIARQHVKVCLSGDGGDELFGGYHRYRHIAAIRRKIARFPLPVRRMIGRLLSSRLGRTLRALRGGSMRDESLWSNVLGAANIGQFYAALNSHWSNPDDLLVLGGQGSELSRPSLQSGATSVGVPSDDDFTEFMMLSDLQRYLPDDILTKVDRASMSCGLEVRVPLLDHRVVEYTRSMPSSWKFSRENGKRPLVRLLEKSVPRELFDHPKRGFGVPIEHWLRGPLRPWAEDLLDEKRMADDGIFNPKPIRVHWQQHLDKTADWHYLLWDVLMFQAWYRAQTIAGGSS